MNWEDVDGAVEQAVADGLFLDWREKLPWAKRLGRQRRWKQRQSPEDILGICAHHSASDNQYPEKTNAYHTGPNHVSPNGAPHILYTIGISRLYDRALLFNDFRDITWSQGAPTKRGHPGDENRHLVSILVFGDFETDLVHKGKQQAPTKDQLDQFCDVLDWMTDIFGIKGFFSHADFGKRACPGDRLMLEVAYRRKFAPRLVTNLDWQDALLRWNPKCLPKFGPDGDWGNESKRALVAFERAHKHKVDGTRDPFTELLLIEKYPHKPTGGSWGGCGFPGE